MRDALRELTRNRELLYIITWREIRIRYKQSVMGLLWAVLMPIIITAAGVLVRVIGAKALGRGFNVADIGGIASSGTAYTDCFIGGIFGNTNPGVPVFVGTDGHLSTTASSARFKDDIKRMANASESLFALKPVTFRYKKEYDANRTQQFGLVAEEVAKVNPDLVFLGRDGEPYTVRYEQVNAMLLNEFLKEHKNVEELKNEMQTVVAQLKEQAAEIQKVSAQIEMSKPASRVAVSKR